MYAINTKVNIKQRYEPFYFGQSPISIKLKLWNQKLNIYDEYCGTYLSENWNEASAYPWQGMLRKKFNSKYCICAILALEGDILFNTPPIGFIAASLRVFWSLSHQKLKGSSTISMSTHRIFRSKYSCTFDTLKQWLAKQCRGSFRPLDWFLKVVLLKWIEQSMEQIARHACLVGDAYQLGCTA